MAFPQVAAAANSIEGVNTTSHTVNLPAGIQSGDLLIAFVATDGDNTLTWPEGWTEIFEYSNALRAFLGIAWRRADGEEGATIIVTSASSEQSAHISYRITGAEDPTTQAPEVSAGAEGDETNPDPDSLTPTGGAKDYLWFAVVGSDNYRLANLYPTNYTNGESYASGSPAGERCACAIARRELNAVSEDPDIFKLDDKEYWVACTVAVHPVAGPPLEQEGFRWRNDNGDETTATYRQNQDVNDTINSQKNIRLRFLVDASGDPDPEQFKLQYKKTADSVWRDMPVAS